MQILSAEVASYLGLELGKVKIKRFADGEIYVQVQVSGTQLQHGQDVLLQQQSATM